MTDIAAQAHVGTHTERHVSENDMRHTWRQKDKEKFEEKKLNERMRVGKNHICHIGEDKSFSAGHCGHFPNKNHSCF